MIDQLKSRLTFPLFFNFSSIFQFFVRKVRISRLGSARRAAQNFEPSRASFEIKSSRAEPDNLASSRPSREPRAGSVTALQKLFQWLLSNFLESCNCMKFPQIVSLERLRVLFYACRLILVLANTNILLVAPRFFLICSSLNHPWPTQSMSLTLSEYFLH